MDRWIGLVDLLLAPIDPDHAYLSHFLRPMVMPCWIHQFQFERFINIWQVQYMNGRPLVLLVIVLQQYCFEASGPVTNTGSTTAGSIPWLFLSQVEHLKPVRPTGQVRLANRPIPASYFPRKLSWAIFPAFIFSWAHFKTCWHSLRPLELFFFLLFNFRKLWLLLKKNILQNIWLQSHART